MLTMRLKKKADLIKRLKTFMSGDYSSFLRPAAEMIRDDIISNIKHQITPDGTTLRKNAPSTLEYKRMYGLSNKSLIARFKLFITESTYIIRITAKRATITLAEVRKNIGIILEGRGYRFFGISEAVKEKILKSWRAYIARGLM